MSSVQTYVFPQCPGGGGGAGVAGVGADAALHAGPPQPRLPPAGRHVGGAPGPGPGTGAEAVAGTLGLHPAGQPHLRGQVAEGAGPGPPADTRVALGTPPRPAARQLHVGTRVIACHLFMRLFIISDATDFLAQLASQLRE